MSLKTTRRAPGFEGIGPGNTATVRLPIGLSYEQILLSYSGATLEQLTELRVVANGEVLMRASAVEIDKINQYEGRAPADGLLIIDFCRYNMRTREAEEFTKIGTGLPAGNFNPDGTIPPGVDPLKITTLALEVDIDPAAVGTALSALMVQSLAAPSGMMKKLRKFTYSPTGAGDYEIADLPKGPMINKVHFFSANISRLVVERDNFTVFDRTVDINERVQADGVRNPQSGLVVYDPTEAGNGAEGLATAGVNDLRFRLTMTGADDIEVLVEYLAPLQR